MILYADPERRFKARRRKGTYSLSEKSPLSEGDFYSEAFLTRTLSKLELMSRANDNTVSFYQRFRFENKYVGLQRLIFSVIT